MACPGAWIEWFWGAPAHCTDRAREYYSPEGQQKQEFIRLGATEKEGEPSGPAEQPLRSEEAVRIVRSPLVSGSSYFRCAAINSGLALGIVGRGRAPQRQNTAPRRT